MSFSFSLRDMPDLCPKGEDLGVKHSAAPCSLTLPLYLGLLPSRKGCFNLGRNSNSPNCSRNYLKDPKKYTEAFTGLTLFYELTWRDVLYVLGQTLTPDSRSWVLGKLLLLETNGLKASGKREHEIALFHTGSQAVPITETLCQMYSWRTQASTVKLRLC